MISLSTIFYGSRGKGIYDSVANAKELGFEGVEFRQEHPLDKAPWKTLTKIKRDFADLGFTIHAPVWVGKKPEYSNTCMGLSGPNRKNLEALSKAAKILEAKNIVFHTGFLEFLVFNKISWVPRIHFPRIKMPRFVARAGALSFFRKAVEIGKETGSSVLIENPPHSELTELLESAEDFRGFFKEIPELGLTLDLSHSMGKGNLQDFVKLGKIWEIHVAATDSKEDKHLPVSLSDLKPLKAVPNLKKIPLVLEHGRNINIKELLCEKKTVEAFLKTV